MRMAKGAQPKSISSFSPGKFGSGTNHPIVNHAHFTDAAPTLGKPSDSFNPGAKAGPLPSGPPKYINAPGVKPNLGKGETNKRFGMTNI